MWHIVKGVKKKLLASKLSDLVPWVRCITNHMWYCASTCGGNAQVLKEKWMGLLHHICNIHEWDTGEQVTKCDHPPYTSDTRERAWLKQDSKAFEVLRTVALDKKLLKDLEKVHINLPFTGPYIQNGTLKLKISKC